MNDPQDSASPELWSLLAARCDNAMTPQSWQRLNQLLRDDPDARRVYVLHMDQHATLLWRYRDAVAEDGHTSDVVAVPVAPPAPSAPPFLSTALHGTVGWFSSGWPLAYLVATVIFGIGLVVGSHVYMSGSEQLVRQSAPNRTSNPQSLIPNPTPKAPFVGRITGMVDCQWEDSGFRVQGSDISKSPNLQISKSLVSLGDKFSLVSGLMEITYDTGAKVILQGPVTYEVESKDGGYLSVGKLTARLEKSESRKPKCETISKSPNLQISKSAIPHPLFAVRTPTATVTDLGTEFGVEVSDRGSNTVCVFVGAVRVENHKCGTSQVAYVGETLEVDARATRRVEASRAQKPFVRAIPKPAKQDSARASFHDDFAGSISRHWINPTAAICRDNRVTFIDRAYLRTAGTFSYGAHDFVATVKMTNAGKGASGAAFFGLGDGTITNFYEEPCADQFPSVYFMYPSPGWIDAIATVHTTQASKTNPGFRKWGNIPATKPRPAGTTITVRLAWTAATDTAEFSIDADGDGIYEHGFKATYPGLSSSEYVSRLFIGGANGVSFSGFNVTVGPHPQATPDTFWDDKNAATKQ